MAATQVERPGVEPEGHPREREENGVDGSVREAGGERDGELLAPRKQHRMQGTCLRGPPRVAAQAAAEHLESADQSPASDILYQHQRAERRRQSQRRAGQGGKGCEKETRMARAERHDQQTNGCTVAGRRAAGTCRRGRASRQTQCTARRTFRARTALFHSLRMWPPPLLSSLLSPPSFTSPGPCNSKADVSPLPLSFYARVVRFRNAPERSRIVSQ